MNWCLEAHYTVFRVLQFTLFNRGFSAITGTSSPVNKMKRARTEHIHSLVLGYLKKRNYTDSEASFKLDFKFEETKREMTTRLSEETDSSLSNAAAIGVFSIDEYFTALDEFLKFCHQSSEEHPKLIDLVYPMFCHMYLDLVMSNRKGDATNFLSHYEVKVSTTCNVQYPPMEKLALVIMPSDLESSHQIKEFRQKKFSVDLTQETSSFLMRFLHASSCLVLLKIINLHISINIIDDKNKLELFSSMPSTKSNRGKGLDADRTTKKKKSESKGSVNGTTDSSVRLDPVTLSAPSLTSPNTSQLAQAEAAQPVNPEIDMKTLKDAIQRVNDLKPSVDNICLHTISNTSTTGLTHATFSNNCDLVCSGSEDSTARLWDMSIPASDEKDPSSETEEATNSGDSSRDVSKVYFGCDSPYAKQNHAMQTNILRAHSDTVSCSCFSHDDQYLITGSEDKTVRLWDLSTRKNKVIYRGHNYPVWCIAMSNYSLYFATGSMDRTAKLWTTERTHPLRTFAGHHHDVESVAFHGNATYLASADKTIRLWDISSGKTVRLLLGHWAAVYSLAFSPNGKFLASSGEDGRIRLWDIASGSLIKEIRGHEGSVYTLDFSPDGSMLASGGADSCLRVWNTRTAQSPSTRSNTDTNDSSLNPDFVGKWDCGECIIHTVKFEATNLLHCVAGDK